MFLNLVKNIKSYWFLKSMKLKIKRLTDSAIIPSYAHEGDAGLDLYSNMACSLEQGQRMLIKTGISVKIPKGYVGLVWPRSGLSVTKGVDILAGVIDSSYRGEIGIVLLNTGYDDVMISKGDRIAQLLIQPIEIVTPQEVEELEESERGVRGFGSTGS